MSDMFKIYAATDVGCVRSENQDAFFLIDTAVSEENFKEIYLETAEESFYAVVADGVGGSDNGAFAAKCCVEYMKDFAEFSPEGLWERLNAMNGYVYERAKEEKVDTASTVAGVMVTPEESYVFNVGDSPVYAVNHQCYLQKMSVDDTALGLMNISESGKKQPLLAYIGSYGPVDCHIKAVPRGRSFLICTDGVTDMLSVDNIEEILDTCSTTEERGRTLIRRAKEKGGHDNITLILLEEVLEEANGHTEP